MAAINDYHFLTKMLKCQMSYKSDKLTKPMINVDSRTNIKYIKENFNITYVIFLNIGSFIFKVKHHNKNRMSYNFINEENDTPSKYLKRLVQKICFR